MSTISPRQKNIRGNGFIIFLWGVLCGLLIAVVVLYFLQSKGLTLMHNQERKDSVPTRITDYPPLSSALSSHSSNVASSTDVDTREMVGAEGPSKETSTPSNLPKSTDGDKLRESSDPKEIPTNATTLNTPESNLRPLFYIQAGVFRDEEKATIHREVIRSLGVVANISLDKNSLFIVQAGPFFSDAQCQVERGKLQTHAIPVATCRLNQ